MEFQEFINKKDTLQSVIKDLKLKYVYSKTKLRIGDVVKFKKKVDSYLVEKDEKYTEKIYDFEVFSDGLIYAKCGNHQTPNINDCKKV